MSYEIQVEEAPKKPRLRGPCWVVCRKTDKGLEKITVTEDETTVLRCVTPEQYKMRKGQKIVGKPAWRTRNGRCQDVILPTKPGALTALWYELDYWLMRALRRVWFRAYMKLWSRRLFKRW